MYVCGMKRAWSLFFVFRTVCIKIFISDHMARVIPGVIICPVYPQLFYMYIYY